MKMNNINIDKYWLYNWTLYNDLYFCHRRVYLNYNKILVDKTNLDIIEGNIQQNIFNTDEEFRVWNISIDKIRNGVLYEHKKSPGYKDWIIAQMRAYIFILNKIYWILIEKCILNITSNNIDIEEVIFDDENCNKFIYDYIQIDKIVKSTQIPPKNYFEKCKKCSYFEKCNV